MNTSNVVTVIGGGFSGLATAYLLQKEGFSVELHEKTEHLGGLIGTKSNPFGPAETAANSLIRSEAIMNLLQDLQVETVVMKQEAKKRFIYRKKPTQWPLSVLETCAFVGRVLSHGGKSRFKPRADETLEEWGVRHLGHPATKYLLGPVMQGIYAGDIRKMSAKLMLGRFFTRKKDAGAVAGAKRYGGMVAPVRGMEALIEALAQRITARGGVIKMKSAPVLKEISGPVVICTNAHAASLLLKEDFAILSQALAAVEMLSVATITVFYKYVASPIKGFGVLVPRDQGCRALGILANPMIFANRGSLYNESWILGGAQDPSVLSFSAAELKALILKERESIMGNSEVEIAAMEITKWAAALPHYTASLLKAQEILSKTKIEPSYYLVGNYLAGIGLSKILEHAHETVKRIKANVTR